MDEEFSPEPHVPRGDVSEDAQWIATILERRCRDSEGECYSKLLRKYWKVVMVLAVSKVGDRREAEDIAQEAFVRAFRYLDKLDHPVAFLGWLLRITRNLITDHMRSRKVHVSLDLLGDAAEHSGRPGRPCVEPEFLSRLEASEETEEVLKAMNELPDRYREVVALRYLQGLSGRKMAEVLGEPEGTIRNRLFRALGKLREVLALRSRERP